MKKLLTFCIVLVLSMGILWAHAETLNLSGDWIMTLSMEGRLSGDLSLSVYEDGNFAIQYPVQYTLDPIQGVWTFEDNTLTLTSEKIEIVLTLDTETNHLTGEWQGRTLDVHPAELPESPSE